MYIFSAPPFICAVTLLCSAAHECAHLLCAKALGRRISPISFSLTGLYPSAGTGSALSCAVIYASGPFVNIVIALISLFALRYTDSAYPADVFSVNAVLALFNLLPIPFSDGDGLLRLTLGAFLGETRSALICSALELLFSFMLFVIFSYRFFVAAGGIFPYFLSVIFVLVSASRLFGE